MLGLTQGQVARVLGCSYQQVHKYERGINRISALHLRAIAHALEISVESFFEGLDGESQDRLIGEDERRVADLARRFVSLQAHEKDAVWALVNVLARNSRGAA